MNIFRLSNICKWKNKKKIHKKSSDICEVLIFIFFIFFILVALTKFFSIGPSTYLLFFFSFFIKYFFLLQNANHKYWGKCVPYLIFKLKWDLFQQIPYSVCQQHLLTRTCHFVLSFMKCWNCFKFYTIHKYQNIGLFCVFFFRSNNKMCNVVWHSAFC